jgi:hypothetical protein
VLTPSSDVAVARCDLSPLQQSYQRVYETERNERGVCRKGACVPRVQCAELCATEVGPEIYALRESLMTPCSKGDPDLAQSCSDQVARHSALQSLTQQALDRCMGGCGFASFEAPPPVAAKVPPSCTSDWCREAQDQLDSYILGGKSEMARRLFPAAQDPGIIGRRPAFAGTAEYPAQPRKADGMRVAQGVEGPEGEGPYLFLDRCPIRRAIVSDDDGVLDVELIFVTRYPPGTFTDNHESVTHRRKGAPKPNTVEVRLPTDAIEMIQHECISYLMGHIGVDENGQSPRIGVRSTVLSLEELAALPTR